MKTFFILIDQAYGTLQEAIAAETKLLEAGYPLTGEYIQQWWIDDSGEVVSSKPEKRKWI